MPVAVTENVAVCPAVIVTLEGCVVIEGGTLTVKVAVLLVTEPATLEITTLNWAPLSVDAVAGVV